MVLDFVKNILEKSTDRSVDSQELVDSWINSETEYHLNGDRANILRGLELGTTSNILELGCSSGLLSRYLGEQGHRVVAVEEDLEWLQVARLRCSDLENVSLVASLEEGGVSADTPFDLVVLSGPTATVARLSMVKDYLAPEGVVLVAVANRLGLKYWLRGTGKGERKSRKECLGVIRTAGYGASRCVYPFPDHHFPDLLFSEEFITRDPHAHSLLYRVDSRDYADPGWFPERDEFLSWKSLHEAGYLGDFSNSFLLIAGHDQASLDRTFPYDFIKLSKSRQQSRFHTVTYKKQQQSQVIKESLAGGTPASNDDGSTLSHEPTSHEYLRGPLLATLWIDALVGRSDQEEFERLVREYSSFLTRQLEQTDQPGRYLDLLPFNIIVDPSGEYRIFDQEWTIEEDISAEFILFRALLWFCFAHANSISQQLSGQNITTIHEWITWLFGRLGLAADEMLPDCIKLEGRVQKSIDTNQGVDQVRATLLQPFQQAVTTRQTTLFQTQLFWVTEDEPLSGDRSEIVRAHMGHDRQTLFFTLPKFESLLKVLRFDPMDQPGFFHLYRMTLTQDVADQDHPRILWEAKGGREIAGVTILENIHHCTAAFGDAFLSLGEGAQVIIELPDAVMTKTGDGPCRFEVEMDCPQSRDHLVAMGEIMSQRRLLQELKVVHEHVHEQYKIQVRQQEEARQNHKNQQQLWSDHISNLSEQISELRQHIGGMELKLKMIRATRLGKLFKIFRV